ncbi:YbaB/EbfC family nucleoid-associated protein [Actinorhabdospora filicis]|nr:YbaB/EbfC family nucleoid-associated protein [Actinorhabdospora filicis]
MLKNFEERAAKLGQMRGKIQDLHGSAHNRDGSITVTVAPNGALLDVKFSPKIAAYSHQALAMELMDVVRKATAQAAETMEEEMGEALGEDYAGFKAAMSGAELPPPISPESLMRDIEERWSR